MPLVSVIIPTYRRPDLLMRAIGSVLAQTMTDLEILVVGEQDDSQTPVALETMSDNRVRYIISSERCGPGPARDRGAKESHAKWIAFLDDDDEWLTEKLEKQIASLDNDTTSISTTLSHVVTAQGNFIWPSQPYDGSLYVDDWLFNRQTWFKGSQSMLQTSSLVVPKALFDRLTFGRSRHEEWEFIIRATKQFGFTLKTVPEPLVIYYSGHTYPWKRSVEWIQSMKDVVTPQAYTGFCLNVATQGLEGQDRNRAFVVFFWTAIKRGTPTAKQLLAFGLMWLFQDSFRQRIRFALERFRRIPTSIQPPHMGQ